MRRLLFVVPFFMCLNLFCFAQNTLVIPVAKTVSSLPFLEMEGQTVEGWKIKTEFFNDHPLAMAELLHGQTPILVTGSSLALANGKPEGLIIQVATPVWDISSLVTLNPQMKNLKDFEGKTILLPIPGGPLDVQFKAILKSQGLTDKIKLDYAEPPQAAALLLAHKADGACLPEPLASKIVLQKKGLQVFTFAEAWKSVNQGDGRSPQVSLIARRDFAQAHPEVLKALVKVLKEKIDQIKAEPEAEAAKYASVLQVEAEVLKRGILQTDFEVPDRQQTHDIFEKYRSIIQDARPLAPDFFF